MRSGWLMSALVLLASVSAERGAVAAGRGIVNSTKTTEPAPDNADEQQKVSAIKAAYAAGKYDEVIAAATTFQRITKDDKLRAEAGRVVADSLRKKKDWKRACSAYIMLRDRFPKGSDEYFKYHAMAEILRVSPRGVYGQAVARDSESTPNPGPKARNSKPTALRGARPLSNSSRNSCRPNCPAVVAAAVGGAARVGKARAARAEGVCRSGRAACSGSATGRRRCRPAASGMGWFR